MKCVPELTGRIPGEWRCVACGFTATDTAGHYPDRIYRKCSGSRNTPGWLAKIANFGVALAKHVAHGGATCTQEQIDARFAVCQGCPLFNGTNCMHRKCGCTVNDQKKFFNKLAWSSEVCPIGKWETITSSSSPGTPQTPARQTA